MQLSRRIELIFQWALLVVAIFGLSAVVGAIWLPGLRQVEREPLPRPIADADTAGTAVLVRGRADAPALHIFGDYECSACRAFETAMRDVLDALAESGRVRMVYHHATLRMRHHGGFASEIVTCAGAEAWGVHAAIYRAAPEWKRASDPAAVMLSVAASVMPDTIGLGACLGAPETAARIRAARDMADELGIHEVPSMVLDGARIRFTSYRSLRRYLEKRLGRP